MSAPDTAVAFLGTTKVDAKESSDGSGPLAAPTQHVGEVVPLKATKVAADSADFRRWSSRHLRFLLGVDAFAGLIAVAVAIMLPPSLRPDGVTSWALLGAVGIAAWPLWIASTRGYRRHQLGVGGSEIYPVLRAMVIVVFIAALPTAWFGLQGLFASVSVAAPAAATASIGARFWSQRHLRRTQQSGGNLRRVIVVGSAESVRDLADAVERDRRMGMKIAGVCVPTDDMQRARELGLPVVGDLDHVASVTQDLDCHAVAVAGSDATRHSFLRRLAWSLEGVDAELLVHPGLVDIARPRMQIQPFAGLPFVHVEQPHFTGWTKRVKRLLDVVLTGVGLVLISPLLLLIALLIKLDDRKGPVIFRQTRVGIDGKTFTMYKFRSMCTDAERRLAELAARNEGAGPLFKMTDDPRITRVGRFLRRYSLDELPQLFNVIGGSMSLVGPRPSLPSEVDAYPEQQVYRRLKVMPGLTGLWQVSGRSLLSWEESVRLDLWYVENWSIGLDLQILFRTAHAVLAKRGAF